MKTRATSLLPLLLVFFGCTKIEVHNQNLPNLETLTPATIETQLPVFHLTADREDFADMIDQPDRVIYVEGRLSYLDENKNEVLTQEEVQVEVRGKSSAFKKMRSLGMVFSKPLDNSIYQLIHPTKPINGHSLSQLFSTRFRNSGNDFELSMLKDISYTELAIRSEIDVEVMYYRQAHLFVNNGYYGLLNLRTENDKRGMAGLRNVPSEKVTVVKIDSDNGNLEWDEGPQPPASRFIAALKNQDATTLKSLIDESSFIDYIIFQDYVGNFDWPHNNTRMYSVDGDKFRFVLYDLDFAAFNTKNPLLPELEYLDDDLSKLYRELRKTPGFDVRVKTRQKELYKTLSPALFESIVGQNASKIATELPYLIAKYGEPKSLLHWQLQLDLLIREFNSRDKFIREKYGL